MIPKIIHYCWFGQAPKSELNKRCLDSWQRVMPDYQIKEWNETNSPLDSSYSQAAHARGLWSKLSNLVRLQALYAEGGIYLDTDVEAIKNFSPLLDDKCFVGFQQEEENVDWVNNAVAGAEPGHPFLKKGMNLTEEAFAERGEFILSPVVTTTVLKQMGLSGYRKQEVGDVIVYPVEYFYPYPWYGKFSPDCIKENTYCVHYWEGTWLKRETPKAPPPLGIMKRIKRTLISKPQ
jgi:mannosyltransferase OCH1-like enzyme